MPEARPTSVPRWVGAYAEQVVNARGDAERLKRAVQRSPLPMVIVDGDRRYVEVNRPARLAFRLSLAALRRLRIDDLTPPHLIGAMEAAWKRLIETGCVAGPYEVASPSGGAGAPTDGATRVDGTHQAGRTLGADTSSGADGTPGADTSSGADGTPGADTSSGADGTPGAGASQAGLLLAITYYAVADVLPGLHLIAFAPAEWPEGELVDKPEALELVRSTALSPRELQVLELAADGLNGPMIATELSVSAATVRTHFEHIYGKLDVRDRAAAVAKAMRLGLIS